MPRAPNPGAPQRVSANVLAKATSFPSEDEEERTSIEAGSWEEEVSTTVEQGEAADKLRAQVMGADGRRNTSVTSPNGSSLEEPTVDDQHASAADALLPPPPGAARLVVTQGNDNGRSLDVRPGKAYTIGRGIENDLVLTDITASRKHFDLRYENGSWILADLGSGNGTLINSRIEDAPFVLASGDTIEVGNTSFRFEIVNPVTSPALPRAPAATAARAAGARAGNDEASPSEPPTPALTMLPIGREPRDDLAIPAEPVAGAARDRLAGYAGAPDEPSTVLGRPPPVADMARPAVSRSQIVAAPAAPRPRTSTGRPGYSAERPVPVAPPPGVPGLAPSGPSSALPIPSSVARASPGLGDPSPGLPSGLASGLSSGLASATLPGPGAPVGAARAARPQFGYSSGEPSAQLASAIRTPINVVPGSSAPRDATSTELVQPMSYATGPMASAPPPAYRMIPPLSRRVVLGAVGLAVFATVATIAIIKGLSSDVPGLDRTLTALPAPPQAGHEPAPRPRLAAPTVVPAPASRDKSPPAAEAPPRTGSTGSPDPAAAVPASGPAAPIAAPGRAAPAIAAAAPAGSTASGPAKEIPPTSSPPARPPASGPSAPAARAAAGNAAAAPVRAGNERPQVASPPRGAIERRPVKRFDTRPPARKIAEQAPPARADRKRGGRVQELKSEANALYRGRNFSAAAQVLTAALPGVTAGDGKELKELAQAYAALGKAYSIGMAPGTKATEAYQALRRAIDLDSDIGAAYVSELKERLAVTASRAAASYTAAKEYEQAFQAVRVAESLRSTSPTNKSVRDLLGNVAEDLLRAAKAELASDPDSARQKLRQILGMVEPRSATYVQAQKLLSGP